jgi:hypothetical protein
MKQIGLIIALLCFCWIGICYPASSSEEPEKQRDQTTTETQPTPNIITNARTKSDLDSQKHKDAAKDESPSWHIRLWDWLTVSTDFKWLVSTIISALVLLIVWLTHKQRRRTERAHLEVIGKSQLTISDEPRTERKRLAISFELINHGKELAIIESAKSQPHLGKDPLRHPGDYVPDKSLGNIYPESAVELESTQQIIASGKQTQYKAYAIVPPGEWYRVHNLRDVKLFVVIKFRYREEGGKRRDLKPIIIQYIPPLSTSPAEMPGRLLVVRKPPDNRRWFSWRRFRRRA